MTPFKYFLAIFIGVSWYVSAFLYYLLPTVSFWLPFVAFACCIPLFFFSWNALFRRSWRAAAIFSAAWVLAVSPIAGLEPVDRFRFWLNVEGFRIHVAPVERYLSSRCDLIVFVEEGITQQLGDCETTNLSSDSRDEVFYDTTGQFALPPPRRTQEWKGAMYNFFSHCYLLDKAVADPIYGGFYSVVIANEHFGEC